VANLLLVLTDCIAPVAIWLLVPLHDRFADKASDLFDSLCEALLFAVLAHMVVADDYRGADAD